MAAKQRIRLTDSLIAPLRTCSREYTVWDSHLLGLGIRVRTSGGASFVLLRKVGAARGSSLSDRSPRTVSMTFAVGAMLLWRLRHPKPGTGRRIRRRCSAISFQGPRRPLSQIVLGFCDSNYKTGKESHDHAPWYVSQLV